MKIALIVHRSIIDVSQKCLTAFTKLLSQPAFTCSKLRLETIEQGVKFVQS